MISNFNTATARVGLHSEKRMAHVMRDLHADAKLTIARALAGLSPVSSVNILERATWHAERAVADYLDPLAMERDMDAAIAEIEEKYNAPYMGRGTEPTPAEIAREALYAFTSIRSRGPR